MTLVKADSVLELLNPQSKSLAFKVHPFETDEYFKKLNSFNYFSVILVLEGHGKLKADISEYSFNKNSLVCFSLYQPFRIESEREFRGLMINFHPEFFCLHKHRNEVSCNGVLFNNIFESPVIQLTDPEALSILTLMYGLQSEMERPDKPEPEVLIAYLKILLINASRIKIKKRGPNDNSINDEPTILDALKEAIENHFRTLHSPRDYACKLNISTAALNRICKTRFNKTLSTLIADRIITEAKRELYLTAQPIKAIAYELGFNDEFYFSRFFKSKVAISPQFFRDTVGFDQANA
ncbi:AraC family transcriptional activator of pobA [Mucilaginibacter sp. UYP25]|uniref:helix-turn-helix domain-containing protein n=1 Tax=unclassified Mucilaginibacter TaxID=2617802 RepID=UPI0033960A3B